MNNRVHKILLLAILLAPSVPAGRLAHAQGGKARARRRNGRATAATRPVRSIRRSLRSEQTISLA